VIRPDSL